MVERSLILEDDQARRLAEAVRSMYGRDELEIRAEDWSDRDKLGKEHCWEVNDADYKRRVLDEIEPWLEDRKYKPEHLERYKSVELRGTEAVTVDEFKQAWCAMLFMAIDGTSHAR